MVQYPLLLENGNIIRDEFEMREFLCSCGFSASQAEDMSKFSDNCAAMVDLVDNTKIAMDAKLEAELTCDAYSSHLYGLISEVEAAVDRLESGKSGKGYTKIDVVGILKNAIRTYEL